MKLISCLQINVKCFLRLILSFQACVARHAQIIQNKNVLQCLYNISKKKLDEVDFLRVDKHQNFIQVDFNTFGHQGFLQGNTIIIIKSSSAAGRTKHRLGSNGLVHIMLFDIQQSHHQLQETLDIGLATQALVHIMRFDM